jgi:hypothetical protein
VKGDDRETTWQEIRDRSHALLDGVPVNSQQSARAVAVLLGEFVGRPIVAPGHEGHVHRVTDLGISTRPPAVFEVDVRVDPCPTSITLEIVPVGTAPPCPECAAGKHGNCDGNTWDNAKDDLAPCPCAKLGHP